MHPEVSLSGWDQGVIGFAPFLLTAVVVLIDRIISRRTK